jgi:hypothetical protein
MTFPIFASAYAPDLLERPAIGSGVAPVNATATDLAAVFGLDRPAADRRLVCRWHRGIDGRLTCHWEPDIDPLPQR